MPRTKKRFIEEVEAPAPSSSEEDEPAPVANRTYAYPRSTFGGGKQLRPMGGGGKQMRMMQPQGDDDDSDDDDSEEEEGDSQPQTFVYSGRPGGGKQLRPMGGGKQLRFPPADESDEEKSESEEESEEEAPAPAPAPYPSYSRVGGKSLMRMSEPQQQEDSSSSEEEEDEIEPVVVTANPRGGGKVLQRYPTQPEEDEDDDDDDEDDDEDEEEEDDDDDDPDHEEEEEEEEEEDNEQEDMEVDDASVNSTKAAPKETIVPKTEPEPEPAPEPEPEPEPEPVQEESEAEDMEESSEEESSEDEYSDEERELDMENMDENQLIENEADQKYLDSLPEVERESILAERFEKLKAAEDMKKALRENKKRERERKRLAGGDKAKSSKGKKGAKKTQKKPEPKKKEVQVESSDDDDDDDEMPDTSKDAEIAKELALGRTAKNRDADGMKARKQRALDKLRKDRIGSKKDDKEDSDLDDYGDDMDSDSESDAEFQPWLPKKKSTKAAPMSDDDSDDSVEHKSQKNVVEADLEDFVKVTIPRRRLSRWCNEPFFKEAVMDFFVRLALGRDQRTQKPCYRLCKVIGVETGKQYQFPQAANSREKPVTTNKWLNLKFAGSTKLFKMIMISDSKPTEDDVQMYMAQIRNRRGGARLVLSKKAANKMRKMQDDLVTNYTYTVEDIQKSIEEKKSFSKKIRNIGAEKTKAATALKAAESQLEEAKKTQAELERKVLEADPADEEAAQDELDVATNAVKELEATVKEKQIAKKKILDAEASRLKRLGKSEKLQNWAKVNQRARDANKAADVEAYKLELAAQRNGQESGTKDLYARRKTKKTILWQTGEKTEKETETSKTNKTMTVDAVEDIARDDSDDKNTGQEESRESSNGRKAQLADQINDLANEEETVTAELIGTNKKKTATVRVRKGISLQEYLERKAAGTL